jgi:CRP-like cAMP-binding protein
MLNVNQPDRQAKQIDFLKSVPLFASLSEANLIQLAEDFQSRNFRKGDIIFHQGDESQLLYVLVTGKVRVFHITPNGEETTVNIMTRQQVLGEFAVIDGQPRSATVQAISNCTLIGLRREKFLHYIDTMPGLGLAMCRLLVSKARWTTMYAETIAQLDAAGQLLNLLLQYNEEFGQEIEAGKRYKLDLGLNQTDLASLIGAKRGWVNHILQDWRSRDLIEFERGAIIIVDLPRVQAELDNHIGVSRPR